MPGFGKRPSQAGSQQERKDLLIPVKHAFRRAFIERAQPKRRSHAPAPLGSIEATSEI